MTASSHPGFLVSLATGSTLSRRRARPGLRSGGVLVRSTPPARPKLFYGLEKNATTIRLAKMNLAVHGLEGNIQKAITYYEDPHELLGKADYVMANPPFNVDEIDADKFVRDPRLPFGLPGVNKKGKVSNGNYVWISYFYSYLNAHGRAGFVMSSRPRAPAATKPRCGRRSSSPARWTSWSPSVPTSSTPAPCPASCGS